MEKCEKCLYYKNKEKCGECGRLSNVMDNYPMFTPNTNYDLIKSMSVEVMAKLFYGIIHERDLHIMKALEENGIEASLIEALPEIHIAYHKQWLLQEVSEDE